MPEYLSPLPEFSPGDRVSLWSRQFRSLPDLDAFLGAEGRPFYRAGSRVAAAAAWGVGGLSSRARAYARRRRIPFLTVQQGLYHSLDYRGRYMQPCSLVLDASGIYYDATRPSDLETMLEKGGWESPELLAEARMAMQAVILHKLSKYNHAPDASPYMLTTPGLRTRILILDQRVDDVRVRLGMADSGTFVRMLESARQDHPGAAFFLRTHPAVLAGEKKGYLANSRAAKGVTLLGQDVSPLSLLAQADEVYTVNSQMGFEALLLGKKVHCFGMPFYAGWGLTQDRINSPRRNTRRSIEELFAAACILYSRYVNPITGEACSIHEIIRLLAEQRHMNQLNGRPTFCYGFSRREYGAVSRFFFSTRGGAEYEKDVEEAARRAEMAKGRIAVPAALADDGLRKLCARHGIPLLRTQPGFFPELGQGLLSTPDSLLLDKRGNYEDPNRLSTLESLLEHQQFDTEIKGRAARLAAWMLEKSLFFESEFCSGGQARQSSAPADLDLLPSAGQTRRVLLVPAQAENSLAVTLGGQGLTSSQDLVRAVRQARPDDYILFLNIPGSKNKLSASDLPEADFVPGSLSLADALNAAHEVHTLSSLVGLDALLRRIPVHTYGGPFYAGWGLTSDRLGFPRRSRLLSLDELLAASLILYPAYYDKWKRMFCGPEELARLHDLPPRPNPPLPVRLEYLMRDLRTWLRL